MNLSNKKIKDSYGGLLNIGLTGASPGTLYEVTDGMGNVLPIEISTTEVKFTGIVSGITGAAGSNGTSGTSGINGAAGSSGTSGVNGSSGTSGINGANGSSGTSGINGAAGANGSSGTSGINGDNGSSGTSGISGANGSSGTSGVSGTNGSSGTSGINGATGAAGPAGGLDYVTASQAVIAATGATANIAISIVPKGTGAFTLATPDNTSVGGNPRGNYAIELSTFRASADRVASGLRSVGIGYNMRSTNQQTVAIGYQASATNESSIAIGQNSQAFGASSLAIGADASAFATNSSALGFATTANGGSAYAIGYVAQATGQNAYSLGSGTSSTGYVVYAFGRLSLGYLTGAITHGVEIFAVQGDAQTNHLTMGRQASLASAATMELFTDLTSGTIAINVNNKSWAINYQLTFVCTTSGGGGSDPVVGDTYTETGNLFAKRVGGTVTVGTVTPVSQLGNTFYNSNKPSVSFTAPSAGKVGVNVTAPTTTGTNTYRAMMALNITEVGF